MESTSSPLWVCCCCSCCCCSTSLSLSLFAGLKSSRLVDVEREDNLVVVAGLTALVVIVVIRGYFVRLFILWFACVFLCLLMYLASIEFSLGVVVIVVVCLLLASLIVV